MEYETVIGLEVHVQLLTRSKMFCACRADYQAAPPNRRVCPVCLGLPGALPVINKRAVEFTIMTGLALNCGILAYSKFDRKNYPYPDLMKGYQISQYDLPLAVNGHLDIEVDGQTRRVRIERAHLEEDVAKLAHVHRPGEDYSLVDVNRSGAPLMEVVSAPDMRSPEEARQYLMTLHSIVQYLGVSTGNMQDGNFRCDANISLRPKGSQQYGTRAEVKNMNSFRAVYQALNYEATRQQRILEDGGHVTQETRGWVEERGVTVSMRSKEEAHDYRYFPEPDLPPLVIDPAWVEEIRARLPELASQRKARFMAQYGLPEYDARLLTESRALAERFEESTSAAQFDGAKQQRFAKTVSNWLINEPGSSNVPPTYLSNLFDLVDSGAISSSIAKTVLADSSSTGESPSEIVKAKGYTQISDTSVVDEAARHAIAANPQAVADYLKGKDTAQKFLVGQVMKLTKGQAKPALANAAVQTQLEALKAAQG